MGAKDVCVVLHVLSGLGPTRFRTGAFAEPSPARLSGRRRGGVFADEQDGSFELDLLITTAARPRSYCLLSAVRIRVRKSYTSTFFIDLKITVTIKKLIIFLIKKKKN